MIITDLTAGSVGRARIFTGNHAETMESTALPERLPGVPGGVRRRSRAWGILLRWHQEAGTGGEGQGRDTRGEYWPREPSEWPCWRRVVHYFYDIGVSRSNKMTHASGLALRGRLGGAGFVLSNMSWGHCEVVLHQPTGFQLCGSCKGVLSWLSPVQFLCQIGYSSCNLWKKGLVEVLAWGRSAVGRNKPSSHCSAKQNKWPTTSLLALLKLACEVDFLLLI